MEYKNREIEQKTVLVTGANSLLGTNIVEVLLEKGYFVRGLLRNRTRFLLAPHPHLSLHEGDFTDAETARSALNGCDFVIHAAARTDQSASGYEAFRRVNVEATRQLLLLAAEAGVRRFVHISSANCFGFGTKEDPGDETKKACAPFTKSLYARSKMEAQEMLLGSRRLVETVVVNPTFMLGAYDAKPSSGQIILMGYGKKIIFCPPGGKNFVHVRNVAEGAANALTMGRGGECYILSGENLTYREFFRKLSRIGGRKAAIVVLPEWLLTLVGCAGNLLAACGIENRFSLTNMQMLCVGNFYGNQKAERELCPGSRSADEAISEAVNWFRKTGKIR